MLHINKDWTYKRLYHRLDDIYKASCLEMLNFSKGMAVGMSVEILGVSKELNVYQELMQKIAEQKLKELERRGL